MDERLESFVILTIIQVSIEIVHAKSTFITVLNWQDPDGLFKLILQILLTKDI